MDDNCKLIEQVITYYHFDLLPQHVIHVQYDDNNAEVSK